MVNIPPKSNSSAAGFGIRYKKASGSSVAEGFKQEAGGKL